MPGQHIVQASSEAWPESGAQAERSLNTGWALDQVINSTGGLTTNAGPSSGTAYLSTGDGTTGTGNSFYAIGRTARVVHTGGTAYARVSVATLSSSQTTVTLDTFYAGGTTSLSTVSITSAAVALDWYSTGQTGNLQRLPEMRPTRMWGL